ncbi:MAG: DUF2652 domain-containing protein [Ignavibacteriaceae bacterium]|jgi:hypothetical protein
MENPALIFIPDISGFTEFITQTEIKHSNHIISELVETILAANRLNLTVSEIEGDAVLFYRKGEPPPLQELIEQIKNMFLDFHMYLKVIQRDNVCQCGACRSAINLSLKFIVHYGQLSETVIQNFTKIIGSDVILAHRLLKNNIGETEYMLLTDKYFRTQEVNEQQLEPWIEFKEHTEEYKNFEKTEIKYALLSEIRKVMPALPKVKKTGSANSQPDALIFINAPILLIHEVLTDSEAKLKYIPGLKAIKDSSPINRVKGHHTCVFDDLEIHFVTQSNEKKEQEINYVEEGEASIGFAFISDYRLLEKNGGTELSVKIFPKKLYNERVSGIKKLLKNLKTRMILLKMKKTFKKNLLLFKNYCEKLADEKEGSTVTQ